MKSYQQFLAELKRRHVFRVAGIYGVVSFGVLQAADLMLPRLGLPDWTVTFMVALVVLAFPVVLIIAWAFEVTPDGVKRTDEAAPGELEGIVAQPASQRWPAGVLALVGVAALVGGTWWIARRTAPETGAAAGMNAAGQAAPGVRLAFANLADDPRPSLAVLPFVNMSADEDQEYFSDGMTEEILNTLARVKELRVAARTSAFAFKGRQLDMRVVGDSLGVGYLIEGSVRKAGNTLRITAQLIDAADGSHLWSDQYDRTLDDVFAIQTEIAEAIAEQLKVSLGIDDPSALVIPTADVEAYDLYLAGRARMRERGESLREAIQLFKAAVARDSVWAPAWAGLAEAYELIGWYAQAWDEMPTDSATFVTGRDTLWAAAESTARRALELDPDNASANVALGSVLRNAWRWRESEEAYLRALSVDPDSPEAHQQYAEMLANVGRISESRRAAERAVALDRIPVRILWRAISLVLDGYPEQALDVVLQGLDEFPDSFMLKDMHAGVLAAMGRLDEWAELEADDSGPEAVTRFLAGDLSALSWRDPGVLQAMVALGYPDTAVTLLARGLPYVSFSQIWNPVYEPLREHPAFLQALRAADLEGVTPILTPRPASNEPDSETAAETATP